MSLWNRVKNLFGNRTCRDCEGRGKWQTETTGSDGMTTVNTHYCETCKGRGFITNDEDIDDFDLAGVGTSEHDDE